MMVGIFVEVMVVRGLRERSWDFVDSFWIGGVVGGEIWEWWSQRNFVCLHWVKYLA